MANTAFFARHGLNVQNQLQVNTSQFAFGANIVVTNNQIRVGNTTANAFINTTTFFLGNSTINVNVTGDLLKIANTLGTANLDPTKLIIGISTVNTSIISVGANMLMSSVSLAIGNSTVNAFANSLLVQVSNSTGVSSLQATQVVIGANAFLDTVKLSIGNTTVNALANSLMLRIRDTVNSTNVLADGLKVGNTTTGLATVNSAGFFGNGAGLTSVVPGAAGSTTQVQFNDGGFTNGYAGFTFTKSTNNLVVANNITAATYDTSSDERLKNKHYQISDSLILEIPVWSYSLKSDPMHDKIGLIAQDVRSWIPQAVKENDDGYLSINFDMITSAMLACLKQMHKRIEDLELELG